MDRLLSRLERSFGKLAIENLPTFIVGGMGIVFLMTMVNPAYLSLITLDTDAILHGQVWRLVTFIFIPRSLSTWWILFSLYWVYWIGSTLEAEWGAFKLNVYYLLGILGALVAGLITRVPQGNTYLNYSLLFAFVTLNPDDEFYLLFIRIKRKWFGLLIAAFVAYQFVQGDWGTRAAIVAALSNYFLFFSSHLLAIARGTRLQARQASRRAASGPPPAAVRTARACAICGAKEADDADIRVCACDKCREANAGAPRELCVEHARNH